MKGALSGKRAGDCPEPVFFHAMPTNFWADLIASYCLKKVVKLSAGDEACGMACMEADVPFLGITLSEVHKHELMNRFHFCVMKQMANDESRLHVNSYTKVLKSLTNPTPTPTRPGPPVPPVSSEAKAKTAPAKPPCFPGPPDTGLEALEDELRKLAAATAST